MSEITPRSRSNAALAPRVAITPLEDTPTFADRAYAALKNVILSLDIYDQPDEVRLDERQLANDLGISRTPVREAMAQLEREGFVRSVPRRGIYVVRKTRAEVIELITAWAALESMAARLITQNASDREIAEQLIVSPHTVHRHVANIRHKLGVGSRASAVGEAARIGLL